MNQTTNLGLTQYESQDKFKITGDSNSLNNDMKIIDEHIHAAEEDIGNVPSGLSLQGQIDATDESIAIVVNGDTAPRAISSGKYLFIKNHSTLPAGGYHATANISSGQSVSSSNVEAASDGIANALNSKIGSLRSSYVSTIASAKTIFNKMEVGEVHLGLAASDAATALYGSTGTGIAILSKSAADRWEIIGISFNRGIVSVVEIDSSSTSYGTAKKVTLS